jgi:hypothetical protein
VVALNLIVKPSIVNAIDGERLAEISALVLTAKINPSKNINIPDKSKLGAIVSRVDAQKNIVNVGKWAKSAVNIADAQIARICNDSDEYFNV